MSRKGKNILRAVQWILVVLAYGYLIYRLATYHDWQSLADDFRQAGTWQYLSLAAAVLLFPLNILLESIKWRYLLREVEPMTIREAQRQTYFGFIGAFLTPSRLGDYPARVTMMHNRNKWLTAITLGFVGTLALAFLQVLCGMPSCIMLLERLGGFRWVEVICCLVLILQVVIIIFFPILSRIFAEKTHPGKVHDTLVVLGSFSHKRFLTTMFLSALRYVVWSVQLWLVLEFCGIHLTMVDALISIPAYYLLVTVTPSVPVADAAIRGSWSMVVFNVFSDNIPGIAIAAVLLWFLNTILPMLVGTFLPYQSFLPAKE